MKKFLFSALLCIVSVVAVNAKTFVFPVKNYTTPVRHGFLDEQKINLVLFDARSLPKNAKIEYSSEELLKEVSNLIVNTYPNAEINVLPSNMYYKAAKDSIITIRIAINGYHAAFGAEINVGLGSIGGNSSYDFSTRGEWNGVTAYNISIDDKRGTEPLKYKDNVSGTDSAPNMGGYNSARKCLTNSFIQATDKLFSFIDSVFME